MANAALLAHHRHSGAGWNPVVSLVPLPNMVVKITFLGSGFRRNDEWYAVLPRKDGVN